MMEPEENAAAQNQDKNTGNPDIRFSRLVLQGFKSFPDRTVFDFSHSICAIVGPNGCGKSNVLDALRWVLGEQGPTQLRAQSMSDVIFNGSKNRKALGMAEVSLTIESRSGVLPIGFHEVEVTRRLYRSGDSEYRINKTLCRLRDITDLFLDIRIGKGAYALIEQGRVDSLLTARPADRRGLLEQAAGILKYKVRKKEALAKLNLTERNLERINDVISEVRRRRNILARQARKARKYKECMEEIAAIQHAIHLARYTALQREFTRLTADSTRMMDISAQQQAQMALKSAAVEKAQDMADSIDEELKSARMEYDQQELQIDAIEEFLSENARRIAETQQDELGTIRQTEEMTLRKVDLIDREKQLEIVLTDMQSELETRQDAFQALETQAARLQQQVQSVKQDVQKLRATYRNLLESAAQNRNKRAKWEESIRRISLRQESLRREKQQLEMEIEAVRDKLELYKNASREINAQIAESSEKAKAAQSRMNELNSSYAALIQRVRRNDVQQMETQSQIKSLEQLIAAGEGLPDGPGAILREYSGNESNTFAGLGLLSDLFETDPEYEKAVLAALEYHLMDVIVEDLTYVPEAVLFLNQSDKGRCTFMVLPEKSGPDTDKPLPESSECFPLARVVRPVSPRFRTLLGKLLEKTYLVDNLDHALQLRENTPPPFIFTTLNGEIVTSGGMVRGGWDRSAPHTYRARKQHVAKLQNISRELHTATQNLDREKQHLETRLSETRSCLAAEKNTLNALNIRRAENRRDLDHAEKNLATAHSRKQTVENELQMLHSEADALKKKLAALPETADIENEQLLLEKKIRDGEKQHESLRNQLDAIRVKLADARVGCETFRERSASTRRELKQLRNEKQRLKTLADQLEQRGKQLVSQRKALESQQKQRSEKLKILLDKRPEATTRIQRLQTRKDNEIQALEALKKELHAIESSVRITEDGISEIKIKKAGIQAAMNAILEQVDFDVESESKTNKNPATDSEINDWMARTAELRKVVESLGDVNLAAMEEHGELVERNKFLDEQTADLQTSIRSLRQTINHINSVCQTRFMDAFRKVNAYFGEIFAQLFDGGEAMLRLENEADPLETGVEIICKPPGKKARAIDLLSGGEKALSALALLFAAFKYHPSPILFLDEVDASLDDANVIRFTRFIKSLAGRTQIMMISHNPHTMEAGDALFGITMSEPGISKLVTAEIRLS